MAVAPELFKHYYLTILMTLNLSFALVYTYVYTPYIKQEIKLN